MYKTHAACTSYVYHNLSLSNQSLQPCSLLKMIFTSHSMCGLDHEFVHATKLWLQISHQKLCCCISLENRFYHSRNPFCSITRLILFHNFMPKWNLFSKLIQQHNFWWEICSHNLVACTNSWSSPHILVQKITCYMWCEYHFQQAGCTVHLDSSLCLS